MNPMGLVDLLKKHKTYIQTHNFPDPDAISSAYGLQQFLKYYGVEAILCYDGTIDKLSTKRMVSTFGIEIFAKDEISEMTEEDYIIMVDSQKNNANTTNLIAGHVCCIDHHPVFSDYKYIYKDIRMAGSCATLIGQYFFETDTSIDSNTAAVLAYGIKMDTAEFTRGVTDLDIDIFAYLFKKADRDKVDSMYGNVMEFEDLKAYGAAIETMKIRDRMGFAFMPFKCPDALIATISEFILSLDVVDISVVYSYRDDGIKLSVRSEVKDVNAGAITREALKEYGDGGGHSSMAGGIIPKKNIKLLGEDIDFKIRDLFLNELLKIQK